MITIFVVFISIIYFTYSKFTSSGRFTIVDTTVQEFSNSDYVIASYIDGVYSNSIMTKEEANTNHYVISNIDCTNNAIGTWDSETWSINISNALKKTKCSVYFEKESNFIKPTLFQGLIPVTYGENGEVLVANSSNENSSWFSYFDHKWANAVLVNCENSSIKNKYFNSDMSIKANAGTEILMDEILQMYVWIPRYKYKLFNVNDGTGNTQMIDIVFENSTTPKSTVIENGKYYTHPAFTFGNTELEGIWVGKFEMTGTTTEPTIKPNLKSLTNLNLSTMFNAAKVAQTEKYGINPSTSDIHTIKNMEWGAIAYLTNSKYGRYIDENTCIESGCEVWMNNINTYSSGMGPTITGCSASSVSGISYSNTYSCTNGNSWNELGVNASTTGNIYGIYDMSGGTWEYVMAAMKDASGNSIIVGYSGFSAATLLEENNKKYYDLYDYSNSFSRYHIGDATKEVLVRIAEGQSAWYEDGVEDAFTERPWLIRSGRYSKTTENGIFLFYGYHGGSDTNTSFRSVLTAS